MLGPYYNPNLNDSDLELADEPACGSLWLWCKGAVLPLILVIYGVMSIITQSAIMPTDDNWLSQDIQLFGKAAICFGIALIGGAMYIFGNLILSRYNKTHWLSVVFQYVGLFAFAGGMVAVMIYCFIFDMFV